MAGLKKKQLRTDLDLTPKQKMFVEILGTEIFLTGEVSKITEGVFSNILKEKIATYNL